MIDKINGNGVYYPDHNKKKNPAVRAYENTPGTKEAAERKTAKTHKTSQKEAADSSESGVILDLSGKAGEAKRKVSESKKPFAWTGAVRKLFAPVLQWLKAFWESDSPKAGMPETGEEILDVQALDELAPQVLETDEGQEDDGTVLPPLDALDETIDWKAIGEEAVKSGSIQKIEQFVTQNGTKHLAHNSDLLTYYDRKGKIVELDETEKHRVLYGDKNVLKL